MIYINRFQGETILAKNLQLFLGEGVGVTSTLLQDLCSEVKKRFLSIFSNS